ncbi:MAG: acyltransferase [Candidatus Aenigmatarchaeota archaeon]|nr:MAG: acyltransferase [Candidatus Aenigmarchaeota archaeon]
MIKISKEEIEDLRKNNRKFLKEIKFKLGSNPARRWYKYKNPIKQAKNYFIVLICKHLPPCELKNHLYRLIGVTIGKNVSIANDAILDPIFPELIKIEDNAIIGWGTKLFTHEFTLDTFRIGSIILRKNSMIGEFSVARPGVTIGKNSMIAAMSFVNEDVEDNSLEGGVPIHIIKHYKRMNQ